MDSAKTTQEDISRKGSPLDESEEVSSIDGSDSIRNASTESVKSISQKEEQEKEKEKEKEESSPPPPPPPPPPPSSSNLTNTSEPPTETYKNLEQRPYYRKLMDCACGKVSDEDGFPRIAPSSSGSNGSYTTNRRNSTDSLGKCFTTKPTPGEITFINVLPNNDTVQKSYLDYGDKIVLPNKEKYMNRCFILTLAHLLNKDVCEFYETIIAILEENETLPGMERLKNTPQSELSVIVQDSNNTLEDRDEAQNLMNYLLEKRRILANGTGGANDYLDGSFFLKYFYLGKLLPNGLIILVTNNNQFDCAAGAGAGGGIYISPNNNQFDKPTLDTPIIYNLGDTHYVLGNEVVSEEILQAIINRTQNMSSENYEAPFDYPGAGKRKLETPLSGSLSWLGLGGKFSRQKKNPKTSKKVKYLLNRTVKIRKIKKIRKLRKERKTMKVKRGKGKKRTMR